MAGENKPTARRVVVAIDQAELMCRILEASAGWTRPEGVAPRDVVLAMDATVRATAARIAHATVDYFVECLGAGTSVH